MAWSTPLICTCLCVVVLYTAVPVHGADANTVDIRIVRGAPRGHAVSQVIPRPNPPVASRSPSPVSGPEHMHHLDGLCWSLETETYEYKLCPYRNITQRELAESWTSFYGLLGIWDSWVIEDGRYTGMSFTDGTPCSDDLDRSTVVRFECGPYKVLDVEEPDTCVYTVRLQLPDVCGLPLEVPEEVLAALQPNEAPVAAEATQLSAGDSSSSDEADTATAEAQAEPSSVVDSNDNSDSNDGNECRGCCEELADKLQAAQQRVESLEAELKQAHEEYSEAQRVLRVALDEVSGGHFRPHGG